jgi:hypothetical protein
VEGSPYFGEGSEWLQKPTPDYNPSTSKDMTYLVSQELDELKQCPVENFSSSEAIPSMQASAKNAIQMLIPSLA